VGIFGWSYPAGCSGPPYDDIPELCEVCGLNPDRCTCPECPVCGMVGDPDCQADHGLVVTTGARPSAEPEYAPADLDPPFDWATIRDAHHPEDEIPW
jgi:hypothetical protein